MRQGRLHLIGLAVTAAALVLAAPASALDYCVEAPGCAPANTFTSVPPAIAAAEATTVADTVTIGAGTYSVASTYTAPSALTVKGAGVGLTVLTGNLGLLNAAKTITDVTIDSRAASALSLEGGTAERVAITGSPGVGVDARNRATLRDVTIDVTGVGVRRTFAAGTTAVLDLMRTRIASGSVGVDDRVGAVSLDHVRIDAPRGIDKDDTGLVTAVDTAVALRRCTTRCAGIFLRGARLDATRMTVAGPAAADGLVAHPSPIGSTVQASTLRDSIVSVGGTDLVQNPNTTITARNSAFRTFSGDVTIGGSYFQADPRLADVAGGDLRLRGDSPLIDKAAPAGALDLAGAARAIDGNGDGTAAPDLGAYERQDWGAAAAGPDRGTAGQAVGFTAAAPGTVPNDPLSWSWTFDDGGTASGREVSHVFADAGTHTATVTVTDGAGVKRTATVSVPVDPAPVPTAPPSGPGDPQPPVTPAQPADLTVPRVGLSLPRQRLSKLSRKGIAVTLDASEPAAVSLALVVDAKTAKRLKLGRKPRTIGKLSTRIATGRQTVRVKLSSKVRKALGRSRKTVKLSLRGTARDEAGNAAPLTGRASLRR